MTQAIKQFLEADALVKSLDSEELHNPLSATKLMMANNDFITAARCITPDIRNLLAAFEQVCEALVAIGSGLVNESDARNFANLTLNALNDKCAAPYRKGGV